MKRGSLLKRGLVLLAATLFVASSVASAGSGHLGNMDFGDDGDKGTPEMLWLSSAGTFGLWEGITYSSTSKNFSYTATAIGSGSVDLTAWSLLGYGDFGATTEVGCTAEGFIGIYSTMAQGHNYCQSTLLWRSTDGLLAAWPLRPYDLAKWAYTPSTVYYDGLGKVTYMPSSTWEFVGIGDFDGNGIKDVAWRSSEYVYIWYMSGGKIGTVQKTGTKFASGYVAKGVGDVYNGATHMDDIIWEYTSGTTVSICAYGYTSTAAGTTATGSCQALSTGETFVVVGRFTGITGQLGDQVIVVGSTGTYAILDQGTNTTWTKTAITSSLTGYNVIGSGNFGKWDDSDSANGGSAGVHGSMDELVVQKTSDGQIGITYISETKTGSKIAGTVFSLNGGLITTDSGWSLISQSNN